MLYDFKKSYINQLRKIIDISIKKVLYFDLEKFIINHEFYADLYQMISITNHK